MAKYKVGDELIIINDPTEENEKLKSLTKLTKYFLQQIIKDENGGILNVASTAAF